MENPAHFKNFRLEAKMKLILCFVFLSICGDSVAEGIIEFWNLHGILELCRY